MRKKGDESKPDLAANWTDSQSVQFAVHAFGADMSRRVNVLSGCPPLARPGGGAYAQDPDGVSDMFSVILPVSIHSDNIRAAITKPLRNPERSYAMP